MNRHPHADVWSGAPVQMPHSDDLWVSTLSDIATQWGWLIALVAVGLLVSCLDDRRRPPKGR